jgi:hypothetical protein
MMITTISVRMEKNKPRIPQPSGLRPFVAAMTAHTMAAIMLPIATNMPLSPRRIVPQLPADFVPPALVRAACRLLCLGAACWRACQGGGVPACSADESVRSPQMGVSTVGWRSVSFDESPAHRLGAAGGLKIALGGTDD